MRRALEVASAFPEDVPVGAVVFDAAGEELAAAGNEREATGDPTAHAEMLALRSAAAAVGNYRLDEADLYVTLEPCPMCAGALVHARIRRLIFGVRDLRFGGVRSKFRIADTELLNHRVEVMEGVLAADCLTLLKDFFAAKR